jgi:hypothetical protein
MSWCGARNFTIVANETYMNSFLANQLIYEGCTSCLTLNVSSDGFTANITAKIQDAQFTGQNFSFVLNMGVADYIN